MTVGTALAFHLGGVAVTGNGTVPLNNDLADYTQITPTEAAGARADFEDDWNQLNLIRTVAITASFAGLATAATLTPPSREPDGSARLLEPHQHITTPSNPTSGRQRPSWNRHSALASRPRCGSSHSLRVGRRHMTTQLQPDRLR